MTRSFNLRILLSLAALVGAIGISLASAEATTITLPAPNVSQVPPAVTTNSLCHIFAPQRLPGYTGPQSAPVYPDCDPRSHAAPQSGQFNAPGENPPFANCSGNPSCFTWQFGSVVQSAQETIMLLNCASTCWGNPSQFETDLFDSAYIHAADQYMTGTGVHKSSGRYTVNTTTISLTGTEPHTLQDADIQTLIINAINQQFPGGCGGGTTCGGYTHMYALFLPSGQDFCANGTCYCPDNNCGSGNTFSMCGYHGSFTGTDAVGASVHVLYQPMGFANVTDVPAGGLTCALVTGGPNGTETDSQNSEFLHETFETITDPDAGSGWLNGNGQEIADPCEPIGTTFVQNPLLLHTNSYASQEIFSNQTASCVGTYATLATTHDLNADMNSDILWRDLSNGALAGWLMNGSQVSSAASISQVPTVWSVAGTRDFNADGRNDILWLDGSGDLGLWLMNGNAVSSTKGLGNVGGSWKVAGTGDFNHDGTGDILWRNNSTNDLAVWLMSNGQFSSGTDSGVIPAVWTVVGTGDFNGDGTTDILWRNTTTNDLAIWLMSNGQMSSGVDLGTVSSVWSVVGTGDFNGDGISDILWRDTSGDVAIWLMNSSGQIASSAQLGRVATTWSIAETGDFDGDGRSDLLWTDSNGDLGIWFMNGLTVNSEAGLGNVGTAWTVQSESAE